MPKKYDNIVIGGGLYGLYAADYCAKKGQSVLILEYDPEPFSRATYINQARVHLGYHYPRSYSTAIKSANYFDRFNDEFSNCINSEFDKVYAISNSFSWTNGDQFEKFCVDANIPCDPIGSDRYFKEGVCQGVFITKEFTYDAKVLLSDLLASIQNSGSVDVLYNARIESLKQTKDNNLVSLKSGEHFEARFLLNATYASVNQILDLIGLPKFKIKYELCEIILCKAKKGLENVGITVMDGPFFSIMPFGKTGLHSLTSVTFTPHKTSYSELPEFPCQKQSQGTCSPRQLGNCNTCVAKPKTAWNYMSTLARKYLKDEIEFEYVQSLFSMKPILMASEIDDSRPTVIKKFTEKPAFVSVLSGKINTMFDLEEILNE
jgi:hypothetical protein